jgi:NAD dependent epimerase/dehydratase family enzyme
MPAFVVKLMLGQMGEEALLASMRVISNKLPPGFTYQHETIESALRAELALPER